MTHGELSRARRTLEQFPELEVFSLANTQVTGTGLVHPQGLRQRKTLVLMRTTITGSRLRNLQQLSRPDWILPWNRGQYQTVARFIFKGCRNAAN